MGTEDAVIFVNLASSIGNLVTECRNIESTYKNSDRASLRSCVGNNDSVANTNFTIDIEILSEEKLILMIHYKPMLPFQDLF